MAHAILSASGASRWMACPPSARLEEQFENKSSDFAREGTLAHDIAEVELNKQLGNITSRSGTIKRKKLYENELFTPDMPDYVALYVDTVMEKVAEAKEKTPDAVISIEQRLNFSEYVPDGFGTGDAVIIADGTMEIIDLKYGKGTPVSAIGNKQMRLYALGAIQEFSFLYDIQQVKMTIVQPRLDSISSDTITADELTEWAENFVKPTAELAFKGEGEFCAGDHCKFCRAKAICRERAEKNLELARYDFAKPPTLDNSEISNILGIADGLVSWAKDVQEYALEQVLNGENYEGYKVVEGRSNRKWADENAVGEILMSEGFSEGIIWSKKLKGISNMETAIGKKEVSRLLGEFIIKPQGKPTLVTIDDKREVYNSAKADFNK